MSGFAAVEDFQYVSPGSYNVCACSEFVIPGELTNTGNVLSYYTISDLGSAGNWTQVVPDYFSQEVGQSKNVATFVKVPCNAKGQYTLYSKIDTLLGLSKIHSMVLNVQKCKVLNVIPVDVKNQVCAGDVAVYDFVFENSGIYNDILVGSVDNLKEYSEFSLKEFNVAADSTINGYLYIASLNKVGSFDVNVTFTALKSGYEYTVPIHYEAIDCTVDVSKDKDASGYLILLWVFLIIFLIILLFLLVYLVFQKRSRESQNQESINIIVDAQEPEKVVRKGKNPSRFSIWWNNMLLESKRRAEKNKKKFQNNLSEYEKQKLKDQLAKKAEDTKLVKKQEKAKLDKESIFALFLIKLKKRKEELRKLREARAEKKKESKEKANQEKRKKQREHMLLLAKREREKQKTAEKKIQEKLSKEKAKKEKERIKSANKKAAMNAKAAKAQVKKYVKAEEKKIKEETHKEFVFNKKKVSRFFRWILILVILLLLIWLIWWLFSTGKVSEMVGYISNMTNTSTNDTLANGTGSLSDTLVSNTTDANTPMNNTSDMNILGIAGRNPIIEFFTSYSNSCSSIITLFLVLFIASLFLLGIKIKRNWSKKKKYWMKFMSFAVPSLLLIALIFSFVFCVFNNVGENSWPGTCKYIVVEDVLNATLGQTSYKATANITNDDVAIYTQSAPECFCHTLFGNIPVWLCLLLIFLVILIILFVIWISLSYDEWMNKYSKYKEKISQEREDKKRQKQKLKELRAKEKRIRIEEKEKKKALIILAANKAREAREVRKHEIYEQKIALAKYKSELKAKGDKDKLDKKIAMQKHRDEVKLKKLESKNAKHKEFLKLKQEKERQKRRKSNGIMKDILLLLLLLLLILGIGSCFFDGNPLTGYIDNDTFNKTNVSSVNDTIVNETDINEFIESDITKNIICEATVQKSDVSLNRGVKVLYSWYVLRSMHNSFELVYSDRETNLLDASNLEKDDLWICQVSLSDGSQRLNTTPFKIITDGELESVDIKPEELTETDVEEIWIVNESDYVVEEDTKDESEEKVNETEISETESEKIDKVKLLVKYVKDNNLEDGFNYRIMSAGSSEDVDLTKYFIAPDGEPLFFESSNISTEEIDVSVWKGIATIKINEGYYGVANITFIAMDLSANETSGVMTIIVNDSLWPKVIYFFEKYNTIIIIIVVVVLIVLLTFIYAAIIHHDNKPKKKVVFSRIEKQIVKASDKKSGSKKDSNKNENELDYEIKF